MKKIIDGKRYDTATATEIGSHHNGRGRSDFRHMSESLYRTPRGNWFLAGEGGAMTKYSRPCGDMTGGGEYIIPLSPENAREWLERHELEEAIEKYFADEIEDA